MEVSAFPWRQPRPVRLVIIAEQMEHAVHNQVREMAGERLCCCSSASRPPLQGERNVAEQHWRSGQPGCVGVPGGKGEHIGRTIDPAPVAVEPPLLGVAVEVTARLEPAPRRDRRPLVIPHAECQSRGGGGQPSIGARSAHALQRDQTRSAGLDLGAGLGTGRAVTAERHARRTFVRLVGADDAGDEFVSDDIAIGKAHDPMPSTPARFRALR